VGVCALLGLAGCDVLFHLDEVPLPSDASGSGGHCTEAPRQDVPGVVSTANSLHMMFTDTEPGNTLVLITATATSSTNVETITDSAGQKWAHQITLRNAVANSTAALDVFYIANSASIASLDAALPPGTSKSIAANLTEWRCPAMVPFDGAGSDPGATSTDTTSGSVTTTGDDLVIGAVVFSDAQGVVSEPTPAKFTPLTAFATASQTGARAAYAFRPAGTYQVQWTLAAPLEWVGGIIAFKTR